MSNYTLLTGSTGLLGRYLLRDLLLAGHRVAIVARKTKKQSVSQRIESFLQLWESELGTPLPRPVCFEGNICEKYLGLEEKSCQWIAEHCSSVIHSAAALKFHEEADGEPWRTNVEGTRRVLELCCDAGVRQMHYVSTAYVCGTREERIMEEDLDRGQSFRNDYEKSKLQAEIMVRKADYLKQVTIYRPAVIAGDSQTGYTNTYHGLFMYLQLMCVLARNTEPDPDGVRRTTLQLNITGDEPRNVIPVDWTSAVITHLFSTPESHGRTFHLAPRTRMTARQMIEAGYTYFNSTGVEFVGPSEDRPEDGMERDAYENSMMYRAYEDSDPLFDTTNLQAFAGHLPCPEIDEAMLHRFMAYGEEDRWGKRRQESVQIPFDISKYLESLRDEQEYPSEGFFVGLDVPGVGGGQWSVEVVNHRLASVEPGVSTLCTAVWTTTAKEFAVYAEGKARPASSDIVRQLSRVCGENQERRAVEVVVDILFPARAECLHSENGISPQSFENGRDRGRSMSASKQAFPGNAANSE